MQSTEVKMENVSDIEMRLYEQKHAWPDFSKYGAELSIRAVRNSQSGDLDRYYVIKGVDHNTSLLAPYAAAKNTQIPAGEFLKLTDFVLKNSVEGMILIAPYNHNLNTAVFTENYPLVSIEQVSYYQVLNGQTKTQELIERITAAEENTIVEAKVFKGKQAISRNELGDEVFNIDGERHVKTQTGLHVTPDNLSDSEKLILKAPEDFEIAARALYKTIQDKGAVLSRNQMNVWLGHAFGRTLVHDELISLSFAWDRVITEDLATLPDVDAQLYDRAYWAKNNTPAILKTQTNQNDAMQFRSAASLDVLAGLLLDKDEELRTEKIFVPAAGNGSLLLGLPPEVKIEATELNVDSLNSLKGIAEMKGLDDFEATAVDATKYRYPNTRYSLAHPPSILRQQETIHGIKTSRLDYQVALKALDSRSPNGRSVFVLGADDNTGVISNESMIIYDYIYRHFEVEGFSEISGSVHTDKVGTPNSRLLVVGDRRTVPDLDNNAPDQLEVLYTHESIKMWANRVVEVSQDRQIYDLTDVDYARDLSVVSQRPYRSASNGESFTMVPSSMEGAITKALERVVRDMGNVDTLVAESLLMTEETLYTLFNAEQIDALAMQMHAETRERGFLLGDDTGIGKGRVLAATAMRKIMQGEPVVYVTEGTQHFTGIFKEFKALGFDEQIKPFFFNANAPVLDHDTMEIIHPGTSLQELQRVIDLGALPDEYNIVILTYSQVNKPYYQPTSEQVVYDLKNNITYGPGDLEPADAKNLSEAKARLYHRLAEGTMNLFDEYHNAAGQSQTGENISYGQKVAANVLYASASPASTTHNVASFIRLLPAGMQSQKLDEVLKRGGEAMMELYAQSLAMDGVFIRREHDSANTVYRSVFDDERLERNEHYADMIAPVLQAFVYMSGEITSIINKKFEEFNQQLEEKAYDVLRVRNQGLRNYTFSSQLHNISRLMTAAVSSDALIDNAVDALESGEKPFIPLDMTMGSLLSKIKEQQIAQNGLDVDLEITEPDMKDMLLFNLRKMLEIPEINLGNGEFEALEIDTPEVMSLYKTVETEISKLPKMSVSIIDKITQGIEAKGYSVGEISGRTIKYEDGKLVPRKPLDKTEVAYKYNSGEYDVIITTSNNGYDAHADVNFHDQRPRNFMEILLPQNSKAGWQRAGRTNRFGQITDPIYTSIDTGLVASKRLSLLSGLQNERLSANTTGDRRGKKTSALSLNADLMSMDGNIVAWRLFQAHPELVRSLHLREALQENLLKDEQDITTNNRDYIRHFFSHLCCLPVEEQKYWTHAINEAYEDHVMDMKAQGLSLDRSVIPGVGEIVSSELYDLGDVHDPDSVFSDPVYFSRLKITSTNEPARSNDVIQAVGHGTQRLGLNVEKLSAAINVIEANLDSYVRPFWNPNQGTYEESIEDPNTRAGKKKIELQWLTEKLKQIRPGSEIRLADQYSDHAASGIVTSIRIPSVFNKETEKKEIATGRFADLGGWHISFMLPGEQSERPVSMLMLKQDSQFEVGSGLNGRGRDQILKSFDDKDGHSMQRIIPALSGNTYAALRLAIKNKLGSPAMFIDERGIKHNIIQLNKKSRHVNLSEVTLPYDAVLSYLETKVGIGKEAKVFAGQERRGTKEMEIILKDDLISINLPTGSYSTRIRRTDSFKVLKEQNNWGRRREGLDISQDLPLMLEALKEADIQVKVPGTDRKWVNDFIQDRNRRTAADIRRNQEQEITRMVGRAL